MEYCSLAFTRYNGGGYGAIGAEFSVYDKATQPTYAGHEAEGDERKH